jgi:hypothetical protein
MVDLVRSVKWMTTLHAFIVSPCACSKNPNKSASSLFSTCFYFLMERKNYEATEWIFAFIIIPILVHARQNSNCMHEDNAGTILLVVVPTETRGVSIFLA